MEKNIVSFRKKYLLFEKQKFVASQTNICGFTNKLEAEMRVS